MTPLEGGIDDGYEDALGQWHETPEETRTAIVQAMGLNGSERPAAPSNFPGVLILRPGQVVPLERPGEVVLEDGTVIQAEAGLPPDLPFGYHRMHPLDGGGGPVEVIVSPGRCYLPRNLHIWGWAVQLYSMRSAGSWGIGDLADLRSFAARAKNHWGAEILLINPLHASTPIIPQNPSPYFPSTRIYRNPLYLRIEDVPGAREAGLDLEGLARAGRALNEEQRIDRDAVFRLKFEALEKIRRRSGSDPAFERYVAGEGKLLEHFAVFCALARFHGTGWRAWPSEHRHPESSSVSRYAGENAEQVRFHQWVQYILDKQLQGAAAEIPLVQDLPIGVDPDGADAWIWQDALALDARVGAPPDEYNTRGQDWGLPPFIPHRLQETAYEPFRKMIQATLRHSGGLRIDHVMGLFRLFWIPEGFDPGQGAYVRYPADDLLSIIALESHRAKAWIVGEDLGTVEKKSQNRLQQRRILSYRVLWFESRLPFSYPRQSLAAVTTHDLPTISGLWGGRDLQKQFELDLNPNEEGMREIRSRLREMTGVPDNAKPEEVIVRTHEALSRAPSMIVTATLEDGLGVEDRPNMPGTMADKYPNWSMALPAPLEEIESHPVVNAVARAMRRKKRQA